MNFEELEQQIADIKGNLRLLIPKLIECIRYFENYENHIDSLNKPFNNEQITKDQLIIPVLRELGYVTEFQNNSNKPILNVWSETSLGSDNSKVDYAIFLEDSPYPRMIVEAKALAKIDGKRKDYDSPSAQTKKYYDQYCERILVSVLTNGDRWTVFKRSFDEARRHPTIETNKPDLFILSTDGIDDKKYNNLSSDNGLDKFVRMLCKPVLVYNLEQNRDLPQSNEKEYTSYDQYRRDISKRMYLKKAVSTFFTPVKDYILTIQDPIDKFFELFDVEKIIKKANELAKENYQNDICNEEINTFDLTIIDNKASKKQIAAMQEKRQKQINNYKGTIKVIINEFIKSNDKSSTESVVNLPTDNSNENLILQPTPVDSPLTIDTITNTNDNSNDNSNNKIDDNSKTSEITYKYITTAREITIAEKISQICNADDIRYVDDKQFMTFLISDDSQDSIRQGIIPRNRGNTCSPWFLRFGNIATKDNNDPEHAQNGDSHNGYTNACIGFNLNETDLERHLPGYSIIKGKDAATHVPSIKITSLDDMDELAEAIRYCYHYYKDNITNTHI